MEGVVTDSNIWAYILHWADTNMVVRISVQVLIGMFLVAGFLFVINFIWKQASGKNEFILARFFAWFIRLMARWIPVLRGRFQKYLTQTNQPKKPLTIKRRIISTALLGIYFLLLFFMILITSIPNNGLTSYSTTSKGVLVEVQARRQPIDGFSFNIEFDRPARVLGIWVDVPISKWKTKQFNIRNTETVNLITSSNNTLNSVTANYPFATPYRSVYVYFQELNASDKQLDVVTIKWKDAEK